MIDFDEGIKQEGFHFLIGVDEAGRGPLAGPVVASAVAVKDFHFSAKIADSKKISPQQREKAFIEIYEKAYVGVGIINESVIDRINILEATYMAMNNAILKLISSLPDSVKQQRLFNAHSCLLIDGNRFKTELRYPYKTIVNGDGRSFSIACASIVAKVIRDRILLTYDKILPEYGFRYHKGYGTVKHKAAIEKHGLSYIHRRTFIT